MKRKSIIILLTIVILGIIFTIIDRRQRTIVIERGRPIPSIIDVTDWGGNTK